MGTLGKQRKLQHKYKFKVEIDQVAGAKFKSCSKISVETEDVEYGEGGDLIPTKEPGKATVPDVTLDRGIGADKDLHDWFVQCVDFAKNGGLVPDELKRNLEVIELNRDNTEARRIVLYNCYPKSYDFGEWDWDANEVVIESMVLRYVWPKDVTSN